MALPGIRLCAVHAHRGIHIRTSAQLSGFVTEVLAFSDLLFEELGLRVDKIDFGGSLACPTVRGLSPTERRKMGS